MRDRDKTVPRGKFVALDAYMRKEEMSEKMIQASMWRDQIKRRKLNLKPWKEIIKIRAEINKHEKRKQQRKIKLKAVSLKKTGKNLKPLARLTEKKEKRTCN